MATRIRLLRERKFIEFQCTWPFSTVLRFDEYECDNPFDEYEFDSSVCSSFKTVHKNIGFGWRALVYPNGSTDSSGTEYRGHLGFFLQYENGLHLALEDINSLHFVDNSSLQYNKFDWLGSRKFEKGGTLWGEFEFMPTDMDQLRSRGLVEEDTIQLAVRIKIAEEYFSWKNILEKKIKAEICNSGKDLSAIVKDIVITNSEDHPASDPAHVLDFKIKTTDGYVIWCHKVALQKNDRFLNLMSNLNFKEAVENRVESDYSREPMKEVLHFIYTDQVSEDFWNRDVEDMCPAAHYYELEGLKVACEGRMIQALGVGNARRMLTLADRYELDILKEMSLNLASESPSGLLASVRNREITEELCEEILVTSEKRARVTKILPALVQ